MKGFSYKSLNFYLLNVLTLLLLTQSCVNEPKSLEHETIVDDSDSLIGYWKIDSIKLSLSNTIIPHNEAYIFKQPSRVYYLNKRNGIWAERTIGRYKLRNDTLSIHLDNPSKGDNLQMWLIDVRENQLKMTALFEQMGNKKPTIFMTKSNSEELSRTMK